MKKMFIYLLVFIFSIGFVYSDADELAEAKKIIDAKTQCAKLTENQLEIIGDYLMEQMQPGQTHEMMDKMMGGEGSESLRQMHIAIAKRLYCNDISGMTNYGMMGMMMDIGGMRKMMGTSFGTNIMGYGSGYGMMGSYWYWGIINFLSLVLVIGLVILVYLWIFKLWKEVSRKGK